MKQTKLKAVHLVKEGDVFQVIGIYREVGQVHWSEDDQELSTQVLSESGNYYREYREMKNLAYANAVEMFDLAGVTMEESLAKMEKK